MFMGTSNFKNLTSWLGPFIESSTGSYVETLLYRSSCDKISMLPLHNYTFGTIMSHNVISDAIPVKADGKAHDPRWHLTTHWTWSSWAAAYTGHSLSPYMLGLDTERCPTCYQININTIPASNLSIYNGVLPAKIINPTLAWSCGSNQPIWFDCRHSTREGTHTKTLIVWPRAWD